MGAYFTLIGIDRVAQTKLDIAFKQFESDEGTPVLLFANDGGRTTVLVDEILNDAKSIMAQLSQSLGTAVILLNYCDDSLWCYELFHGGKEVDKYLSLPEYWGLTEGMKVEDFKGNASTIASVWTEADETEISGYLTNKESLSDKELEGKAYFEDEADQGDPWQICDFLKKLGLIYPEDDELQPFASYTISSELGRAQQVEADAHLARASALLDEKLSNRKDS